MELVVVPASVSNSFTPLSPLSRIPLSPFTRSPRSAKFKTKITVFAASSSPSLIPSRSNDGAFIKGSSAMDQLDIERGVCIPFRKYTPESVAYPYVAKRLLTDPNPALRERLIQVLFKGGLFQWKRLENLIVLAKENVKMSSTPALTDTIRDGARLFLVDEQIRRQLLLALTEDSKLHVEELIDVYRLVEDQIDIPSVAAEVVRDLPSVARDAVLSWTDSVLSDA